MKNLQITNPNELLELKDNEFQGELPKLTNSQINFRGKNNILICEENVHLWNSRIDFNLDNSILYLSSSIHDYSVNISLHNDNVCYIGKNNFFNGKTIFVLSESKNIVLGDDCLISYNVVFRVSDGHPIYNKNSKERMNYARSIYAGDHVWFGQNAMIFKGSRIGSGSIIGAGSVVSNKTIPSNTAYGGAPLKLIRQDSFWIPHSVHEWSQEDIEKMSHYDKDLFIYENDEKTLDLDSVERELNSSDMEDVLAYIWSNLLMPNKNRFYLK